MHPENVVASPPVGAEDEALQVGEVGHRADTQQRTESKPAQPPWGWRDVLPVHPAADLFPMMTDAEIDDLAKDIEANELTSPIVLWAPDGDAVLAASRRRKRTHQFEFYLLDGRNRLEALYRLGRVAFDEDGWPDLDIGVVHHGRAIELLSSRFLDPHEYVISANIHRRHLTAEKKRECIAALLKAKPEQSNSQVAKQVKADDKTVASVRRELESTSEIPRLEKTVGADGKARSAKQKPRTASAPVKVAFRNEDAREAKSFREVEAPTPEAAKEPDAFVIARWRRTDDPLTIAKVMLATLRFEPHEHDTGPLKRALETYIKPAAPRVAMPAAPSSDKSEPKPPAPRSAPLTMPDLPDFLDRRKAAQ